MLIVCRGIDTANERPASGEILYDMDLGGFGTGAEALSSGTNIDGAPCFADGKFNGKKIAHGSTYTNMKDNASPIMQYWNYETQQWGG